MCKRNSDDEINLQLQPCSSHDSRDIHTAIEMGAEDEDAEMDKLDTIDAVIDQLQFELQQEEEQLETESGSNDTLESLETQIKNSEQLEEQELAEPFQPQYE